MLIYKLHTPYFKLPSMINTLLWIYGITKFIPLLKWEKRYVKLTTCVATKLCNVRNKFLPTEYCFEKDENQFMSKSVSKIAMFHFMSDSLQFLPVSRYHKERYFGIYIYIYILYGWWEGGGTLIT